ncbi:hypothetical protein EVAR_19738_1 [Eumeta japonica]|uniref:Uncharacterized protein n=1 Tax=Eumeta variegata TaxID=151549 RepID=A0A4C1URQ6_EUMVA|nr:hypothetical protein EVAR_19738_1 [Eumeta japonica]
MPHQIFPGTKPLYHDKVSNAGERDSAHQLLVAMITINRSVASWYEDSSIFSMLKRSPSTIRSRKMRFQRDTLIVTAEIQRTPPELFCAALTSHTAGVVVRGRRVRTSKRNGAHIAKSHSRPRRASATPNKRQILYQIDTQPGKLPPHLRRTQYVCGTRTGVADEHAPANIAAIHHL